jgi:uncharacterized protein
MQVEQIKNNIKMAKQNGTMSNTDVKIKPWRCDDDGVRLFVHLTPKAFCNQIGEVIFLADVAALKVRVTTLPDKGKANQALIKLLSKWLGMPKSSLELTSGFRSRQKCVKIYGKNTVILKLLKSLIK